MARKHNTKKSRRSAPVQRIVLVAEQTERKVLTNPDTGDLEVRHIITPAVVQQGRALAPTRERGLTNDPARATAKGRR